MNPDFRPEWSHEFEHLVVRHLDDDVVVWCAWDEEWSNDETEVSRLEVVVSRGNVQLFQQYYKGWEIPFDPNSTNQTITWSAEQTWTSDDTRRANLESQLATHRQQEAHHAATMSKHLNEMTALLASGTSTTSESEILALASKISRAHVNYSAATTSLRWTEKLIKHVESQLAGLEPAHVRDLRTTLFPS